MTDRQPDAKPASEPVAKPEPKPDGKRSSRPAAARQATDIETALRNAALFTLGVGLLVLAQQAGNLAVDLIGLPVPGALVGMLLLLATLMALGRVPRPIELAAGGLLRHIMLFLMPVVAGVLDHLGLLQGQWLPFLVASLLGTFLTLAVTAVLLRRLLRPVPATDRAAS